MLSFDTETKYGLIYKDGVGSVFMIQWADRWGEHVCDENTGWQPFLDAIEDERDRGGFLVAANATFDIHHLRASEIVDLDADGYRVHDCILLARVCLPGRYTYGLEALGTTLFGADATEAQRELKEAAKLHKLSWTLKDKDYYGLWQREPELMEKYGKEDVRLAYDVWEHIWKRAVQRDKEVYRMEITGVAPLLRASERDGVLVDQKRLAELEEILKAERDDLREKLLMAGLRESSLGVEIHDDDADEDAETEYGKSTPAHLREDLLALGIPLYRKTASSGKPAMRKGVPVYVKVDGKMVPKINPETLAVNKDALSEFENTFPVVADLLAWRNRCKILQTYVAPLKLADPRVHTSFSQAAARTSRMSSSKPNMQNLPTPAREREDGTRAIGVRDVLIPGLGNALLAADFDSIEVRVMAYYLADPDLIAQLDAGLDLHQRTAYRVACARGEVCAFEDFVKGGRRDKDRTIAKITTFTAMYGGGARLLATRLGVSVAAAAAIKAATLDAITGYHAFDEAVKRTVLKRSFSHVTTITGRRLYVPRDKPYVALNTLIQGTSAELMKLAIIAAAPVAAEYDYALRLVVHDEAVFEGPAACAEQAMPAIVDSMESSFPLSPRLVVSADWSIDSYGAAK